MGEQLFFERVRDPLGWILADAEADRGRDFRGIESRANVRTRVGYTECFRNPAPRQSRKRFIAIAAVRAAFEEVVIFFGTDGKQSQLRETGVGIDDDTGRLADGFPQSWPDRKPIVECSPAAISNGDVTQPRIAREQ